MADSTRNASPDVAPSDLDNSDVETSEIEKDLLENISRYSYAQSIRILHRLILQRGGNPETQIQVYPALSMGMPDSELVSIEKKEGVYKIHTNFLGLYGASSPLPTFYTDELISAQQDDRPSVKDFLDIFHRRLYTLYAEAQEKYFPLQAVMEKGKSDLADLLLSCMGLRDKKLQTLFPEPTQLLRYISLLGSKQRSAEGLKTVLKDILPGVTIEVNQCVENYITAPTRYRFYLGERGNSIGDNALLGDKLIDRASKIMISIGPMSHKTFDRLLNDGRQWPMLVALIKFYLNVPLDCDLQLLLDIQGTQPTLLGGDKWSTLGQNTWIFSQDEAGERTGVNSSSMLDARLSLA